MIKERVNLEGWPNCIKLSNEQLELIVTTDVGPRIIKLGYIKGQNLLYISPEDIGKTGGDRWRIYGGHRLWHAPEVMPRTYSQDNNPVEYSWNGKTLQLIQETERITGIRKEMEITLEHSRNHMTILHRLINNNLWDIELSAWAITAFAAGGRAILPQEPYVDPVLNLLPSRPLVLWHYTQMEDPRWIWGNKYIKLLQDPSLKSEQKIGILNKQGWSAFYLKGDILVKYFEFEPEAQYTDYGCNNEIYVNGDLLEVETLSPVKRLAPGQGLEHTEHWMVASLPDSFRDTEDSSIDQFLSPLVNSFLSDEL